MLFLFYIMNELVVGLSVATVSEEDTTVMENIKNALLMNVVLGAAAVLMIVTGFFDELVIIGDLTPCWACWFLSMLFFLYIVYELVVGLSVATVSEKDSTARENIKNAQLMTVISWCSYPVVYLLPMLGLGGGTSVVAVQLEYGWSALFALPQAPRGGRSAAEGPSLPDQTSASRLRPR